MKKNITLIGMMGSGKTTVGNELKKLLPQFSLVDIDEKIEQSTGKKISEIFLRYGEPHFRELENNKIKLFLNEDNQIISAGGGAFENPENRDILLNNSCVVYLKTSPDEIFARIKNEVHRPLLRKDFTVEKVKNILSLREKNYLKAPYKVVTDGKSPELIAKEIIEAVNV